MTNEILRPPVLCLMGPTASGKSAAAYALANQLPLEIINVDSATIYRGMDIGTAKPTPQEQARHPQHLLDILDPLESFSVGSFTRECLRLITDIQARGNIPLLAGGTMMYFKSLLEGLDELPAADSAIRARLLEEGLEKGWASLHQRLTQIDPITAQRLAPMDSQRIQRALEVYEITGQPLSSLIGKAKRPDERFITICLMPQDRSALHARIAQRFDAMLAQGFEQEVQTLWNRGDLHADLPSIRCVGYRQMWRYLAGEIDHSCMREMGIAATRQLAKRQITWLRSMHAMHTLDILDNQAFDKLTKLVSVYCKTV